MCAAATGLLGVYAIRVKIAADQWRELPGADTRAAIHAQNLHQHFGTVVALAITQTVIGVEAFRDYRGYSKLESLTEIEANLRPSEPHPNLALSQTLLRHSRLLQRVLCLPLPG
jgi:hypothetical protein